MPETLVLRLLPTEAATPVHCEWLVAGAAQRRLMEFDGVVQRGELSHAIPAASGRKVVVLAPGADVLLAEPVLPLKSAAKLAQVVPFALEEHLASDVEALHFAVGKRQVRGATPVAVIAREQMDQWREKLATVGLNVDALYAETSLLPETPNGVTLLIENGRVYVRRGAAPGAVLEVDPLIEGLQLALASGDDSREHVTLYVSEPDYEREKDLLEGLREFTASLQLRLLPQGALPLLATQLASAAPVNLLQGPYAAQTKMRTSLAPWRYAAMLAGVLFATHLGLQAWQYVHYGREEARLDQELLQIYQQAMPGAPAPRPDAARRTMEGRLAQLRGGGAANPMLATLAAVGEALAQTPDTAVEALSYRSQITDLRVVAPSVDALDRIRQAAEQRGIRAELQGANPRDSKFEGRLQFKTGA